MKPIYFDNGSTSFPKAPGVSDAIKHIIDHGAFNINRGGYAGAFETADMVFDTRAALCDFFHFDSPKHVVFTPNVTFSLNYLIQGLLRPGDHVIVSSMEHNAVMRPLCQMAKQGLTFNAAQADARGVLDPQRIEGLIRPNTRAVILSAASNVCGTCLPLREVGELCARRHIPFIVDSAQVAGFDPIDMQALHIDALAFTGHKSLLGPQGIGGFLITPSLAGELCPLLSGGTGSYSDLEEMPPSYPDRMEPGTMNLPGIAGLFTALRYVEPRMASIRQKELALTARFLEGAQQLPDTRVVGLPDTCGRAPIVSLDFAQQDNANVAFLLDNRYGVMTRCGLHCAPRAHKTLSTYPQGTVRFSFSHFNTEDEVDACLEGLNVILTAKA